MTPVLEASGPDVRFGPVHAVRGISFAIARGKSFGLVGESGSGKSTVPRARAGLIEPSGGELRLDGALLGLRHTKALRRRMQMAFQDPYGSLHPRQTVDGQLAEAREMQGTGDGERRFREALDASASACASAFATGTSSRAASARAWRSRAR